MPYSFSVTFFSICGYDIKEQTHAEFAVVQAVLFLENIILWKKWYLYRLDLWKLHTQCCLCIVRYIRGARRCIMHLWFLWVPPGWAQGFKGLEASRWVRSVDLGLFARFKKLFVFFLKANVEKMRFYKMKRAHSFSIRKASV